MEYFGNGIPEGLNSHSGGSEDIDRAVAVATALVTHGLKRYLETAHDNVRFMVYSYSLVNVVSTVLDKEYAGAIIEEAESNMDLDTHRDVAKLLQADDSYLGNLFREFGDTYHTLLLEKVYLSQYHNFEVFLADCFQSLYSAFPEFLVDRAKGKLNVYYADIFEALDIAEVRRRVIERKVRNVIQGSTILNSLGKFKSIFGVDIELSGAQKEGILVMANKRHLFVHNKGIVNNIYIEQMRKYGIEPLYAIGDHLNLGWKEVYVGNGLLDDIVTHVYESLIKQMPQTFKYARSR